VGGRGEHRGGKEKEGRCLRLLSREIQERRTREKRESKKTERGTEDFHRGKEMERK